MNEYTLYLDESRNDEGTYFAVGIVSISLLMCAVILNIHIYKAEVLPM